MNRIYKNKKHGNLYRLLYIANTQALYENRTDFPVMVTYQRIEDGTVWCKPFDWFESHYEFVNDEPDCNDLKLQEAETQIAQYRKAIEFARYLVKNTEFILLALNDAYDNPEDNETSDRLYEAYRALKNNIYEFVKRSSKL